MLLPKEQSDLIILQFIVKSKKEFLESVSDFFAERRMISYKTEQKRPGTVFAAPSPLFIGFKGS